MACPRRRFRLFLWQWRSGRGSRKCSHYGDSVKRALSLVILVGRPPRYANVATSDYVPPPNPSTTTEHKTISVCEDEYTKFLQYQAAKL